MSSAELKHLVVHLRLPFQLLLAPVFLWSWLVAGEGVSTVLLISFVIFHVFLYGGVTAFNSYYDRDVGPVGGLEHPPPVSAALLPFSLLVQGAGWVLAWLVNPWFGVCYSGFMLLSVGYSHPRWRWKGNAIASLVVVAIGQGVLACLAAWAAATGGVSSAASLDTGLAILAATLVILGLFPLSQIYQTEEDAARGDRTVAVSWGPQRALLLALGCLATGGALMVLVIARRFGALDAGLVALGLIGQLVLVVHFTRHFDVRQTRSNYRAVMRINLLSAIALGAYLLLRIAGQS